MKSRNYILSILFALAMLFTMQAKADGYNNNCNNNSNNRNNNNCGNTGNSGTTDLPIDSGITFLVVAGMAVGIFAVSKAKAAAKVEAFKS